MHIHTCTLVHTDTYINELHEEKEILCHYLKKINAKYTNFKQFQVYINQMFNNLIRKRSQSLLPRAEESPLAGTGVESMVTYRCHT